MKWVCVGTTIVNLETVTVDYKKKQKKSSRSKKLNVLFLGLEKPERKHKTKRNLVSIAKHRLLSKPSAMILVRCC